MKRFVTILLLGLLISLQTPVGQFFKIPLLIEHFLKHNEANGLSFMGFLAEHYASGHMDADLDEDEQLPFKQIILFSIGFALVSPVIQSGFSVILLKPEKIIFHKNYNPRRHLAGIFHPPRGYSF
ncbi:MAG: hypothetical protein J0M30_01860 [Chitinophagales bacterium]|nr:hypothetical protein [Chitinophagales bacterium]